MIRTRRTPVWKRRPHNSRHPRAKDKHTTGTRATRKTTHTPLNRPLRLQASTLHRNCRLLVARLARPSTNRRLASQQAPPSARRHHANTLDVILLLPPSQAQEGLPPPNPSHPTLRISSTLRLSSPSLRRDPHPTQTRSCTATSSTRTIASRLRLTASVSSQRPTPDQPQSLRAPQPEPRDNRGTTLLAHLPRFPHHNYAASSSPQPKHAHINNNHTTMNPNLSPQASPSSHPPNPTPTPPQHASQAQAAHSPVRLAQGTAPRASSPPTRPTKTTPSSCRRPRQCNSTSRRAACCKRPRAKRAARSSKICS